MISIFLKLLIIIELFDFTFSSCLSEIKAYGPGWDDPSLVLPSRYFFIEYPEKCRRKISKAIIESLSNQRGCRSKQQVFHDTSYKVGLTVIRYRLLDKVCQDGIRIILVDDNGEQVKQTESRQVIVDEDCSCSEPNFSDRMKCNTDHLYDRMNEDLRFVPLTINLLY